MTGATIPVTSTTEHPDSSYGQAVWVDADNNAYCVVGMPNPFYEVVSMDISDRETLGQYLKLLRVSKGITVRGMADLCDLSPATVQNIEKGAFSPRLDILQRILVNLDARLVILLNDGD